jgi:hypothetical protein
MTDVVLMTHERAGPQIRNGMAPGVREFAEERRPGS